MKVAIIGQGKACSLATLETVMSKLGFQIDTIVIPERWGVPEIAKEFARINSIPVIKIPFKPTLYGSTLAMQISNLKLLSTAEVIISIHSKNPPKYVMDIISRANETRMPLYIYPI